MARRSRARTELRDTKAEESICAPRLLHSSPLYVLPNTIYRVLEERNKSQAN